MVKPLLYVVCGTLLLSSCVAKKEFLAMQASRDTLAQEIERQKANLENCAREKATVQSELGAVQGNLRGKENELLTCNTMLENERNKNAMLEQQLEYFKTNNANLLDRLADLSVVSKTGAESIKKSLEAINEQSKYIKDLTGAIQRKDSLALNLVMNLKRSLADVNDEDVSVEVRKGVVYISLSDRMLFKSGSAEIQPQAETVLNKIAKVVNDYKELEILVEGHTDNVPVIMNERFKSNWDLSAARSSAVADYISSRAGVQMSRISVSGHADTRPVDTNNTAEGRARNRRIEIIVDG